MSNARKDLGCYTDMARDAEARQGIADAVHQTFAQAVEAGGAQRYVPELVALLAQGVSGAKAV